MSHLYWHRGGGDGSRNRTSVELYINDSFNNFNLDMTLFSDADPGSVHPRKALRCDYNGDGEFDVVVISHGWDQPPLPGEYPSLIYPSSPSGLKYVYGFEFLRAFEHGGASADIDSQGYLDIFVVDTTLGHKRTGRKIMRKIFLAIILMFIFSIPFRGHALSETHTIVVTNNTEDHRPINVFDCRDRIFVYVNWKGLQGGEHSLEAYWYKPGNKTQDHTVYKFNAPMAATWLWIELKGGRGSKLFKSLDHGAGFEEFVGQWNVKVNLDGEYLSTQYFMVVC